MRKTTCSCIIEVSSKFHLILSSNIHIIILSKAPELFRTCFILFYCIQEELQELQDDDDGPSPGQPPPPNSSQGGGSMVNLLEERLDNYQAAAASAKAAGDSSKQRRLDRGTKVFRRSNRFGLVHSFTELLT